MKKTLLLIGLLASASWLCAEQVRFVTMLSQPVGTFAKVELLDSSRPAEIFNLNFCNNTASNGTIKVGNSATDESLVKVDFLLGASATSLTGNVKEYDVVGYADDGEGLFLLNNGELKGKTLYASNLDIQSTSTSKIKTGEFSANSQVETRAASFDALEIDINTYYTQGNVVGSDVYASNFAWEKVSCASSSSDTSAACNSYVLIGGRTTTGDGDSDPSEESPEETVTCMSSPITVVYTCGDAIMNECEAGYPSGACSQYGGQIRSESSIFSEGNCSISGNMSSPNVGYALKNRYGSNAVFESVYSESSALSAAGGEADCTVGVVYISTSAECGYTCSTAYDMGDDTMSFKVTVAKCYQGQGSCNLSAKDLGLY